MTSARLPRLMAISDRARCPLPLPEWAAMLADAGVSWIQLREKDLASAALGELAESVAARLPAAVTLSVNGLAPPLGVSCVPWSVHVPEAALMCVGEGRGRLLTLPVGCLWGVSVHSRAALDAASRAGADYVVFSPVFAPSCKPGVVGEGLEVLAEVCAAARVPVIALGGVTPARVAACLAAGAHGVAVMSGLCDPAHAVDFLGAGVL